MRVVVAGGSAAGIFTSLLLARAGHDVVMLDRDPIEPASTVEQAAETAFRPAAPQIVQPHGLLPLCRELLLTWLPDVYDDLLAAGMVEAPISTQLPPSLPDRTARAGDERLVMLLGRRSTFDWALRRAVLAEGGVSARSGVRVTGLRASPGRPPRVIGVETSDGCLPADLVVDATGRRSRVDSWLASIGAGPTQLRQDECGLAYYSRHYRVAAEADRALTATTRVVVQEPEFTAGIWGGDHGRMVLVVAPLAEDKRFRDLADPDVHSAVLRTVPSLAAWLEKLEPTSGIYPMGGLANSLRRLVVSGAPVALGLTAVGDSVCTTNPTFGRGLSLAMLGAVDLGQVVGKHGEDLPRLAAEVDRLVTQNIEPFYDDQATNDKVRLAEMRRVVVDPALAARADDPERVTFAELRAAAAHDAHVLRAFWQVFGMLRKPEQIYTDPTVVSRTRQVLKTVGGPA